MNAIVHAARFRSADADLIEQFNRDGFVVIRRAIDPGIIAQLDEASRPIFARTRYSKGSFYGEHSKRFMGLLNHLPKMATLVQEPLVLGLATQLLSECDTIQLNSTQAIEVHPGADRQPPHRDQIVWHERSDAFDFVVSVSWPFNSYSAGNGTTRIWPGTHRFSNGAYPSMGEPVDVEMEPGDVMLFSGRVLHAQGCNSSTTVRRGVILSYSLGWLKQFENMQLTYPPAVARTFSNELADLIGYRMQRPNLGSVGGHCPSALLRGDQIPLGLQDMFTPEIAERVRAFHAAQSH